MRRVSHAAVLIVVCAAMALSACTNAGGNNPKTPTVTETIEPSEAPRETPSETPAETTAEPTSPGAGSFTPAGETSRSEDFGEVAGGDLTMITVDAREDDRIVILLDGADTPAWHAEYTADARTQGKGDEVVLDGDHIFELVLAGFAMPGEDWELEILGDDDEVYVDPPFEGMAVVFLGLDEQVPYRIVTDDNEVIVEFLVD